MVYRGSPSELTRGYTNLLRKCIIYTFYTVNLRVSTMQVLQVTPAFVPINRDYSEAREVGQRVNSKLKLTNETLRTASS